MSRLGVLYRIGAIPNRQATNLLVQASLGDIVGLEGGARMRLGILVVNRGQDQLPSRLGRLHG